MIFFHFPHIELHIYPHISEIWQKIWDIVIFGPDETHLNQNLSRNYLFKHPVDIDSDAWERAQEVLRSEVTDVRRHITSAGWGAGGCCWGWNMFDRLGHGGIGNHAGQFRTDKFSQMIQVFERLFGWHRIRQLKRKLIKTCRNASTLKIHRKESIFLWKCDGWQQVSICINTWLIFVILYQNASIYIKMHPFASKCINLHQNAPNSIENSQVSSK